MSYALQVFVPLLVFMLIPLWIPIIAVVLGRLGEALRPSTDSEPAG